MNELLSRDDQNTEKKTFITKLIFFLFLLKFKFKQK